MGEARNRVKEMRAPTVEDGLETIPQDTDWYDFIEGMTFEPLPEPEKPETALDVFFATRAMRARANLAVMGTEWPA